MYASSHSGLCQITRSAQRTENDHTAEESHSEHHLPRNSARVGYATEVALFISTQLSTDTVRALQMFWVTNTTGCSKESGHNRKHEVLPPWVKKKKIRFISDNWGFICAGVSNVDGYERNA